jgi:hypothetical protein
VSVATFSGVAFSAVTAPFSLLSAASTSAFASAPTSPFNCTETLPLSNVAFAIADTSAAAMPCFFGMLPRSSMTVWMSSIGFVRPATSASRSFGIAFSSSIGARSIDAFADGVFGSSPLPPQPVKTNSANTVDNAAMQRRIGILLRLRRRSVNTSKVRQTMSHSLGLLRATSAVARR